jgi:lipopolysaccharide export LptBFGC system permease protein LptF
VRIISRYVLKEVFTFFSISLLTFTGLLLTVRMLKLTSLIVNRGV